MGEEYAQPVRWKIRLIKPNRFLSVMDVLDVNLSEPLESDILTFASKQELNDLLTRYLYEFVEAKLPQPEVEIVGYDKIGREL